MRQARRASEKTYYARPEMIEDVPDIAIRGQSTTGGDKPPPAIQAI